jgi:lysophospholipase L1-like esterase
MKQKACFALKQLRALWRSFKVWWIAILLQAGCLKWRAGDIAERQADEAYGKPTYVAIGASDTQAAGASSAEKGYVALLHSYLERSTDCKWRLINVGRSGARITDAAQRQLPLALASNPTVVSIWVGGNDVRHRVHPKAFERLLRWMLLMLRKSDALILIANLPEMERQPFAKLLPEVERQFLAKQSRAYNAIIERLASESGAVLVDLKSMKEMYDERFFCKDGLHPNDLGYERIAHRFIKALAPHLHKLALPKGTPKRHTSSNTK